MRNADPAIIIAELMMWAKKKQNDGSFLLGAWSEPERAVSLRETFVLLRLSTARILSNPTTAKQQ